MVTIGGFSITGFCIILNIGGDSGKAKPIQFEVISPGMKAKLSPTYRRNLELVRGQDRSESLKNLSQGNQTTTLTFTTETRAYGTYVRRQ
jgi:hypothetical protein